MDKEEEIKSKIFNTIHINENTKKNILEQKKIKYLQYKRKNVKPYLKQKKNIIY